jgi:hypothetical protein
MSSWSQACSPAPPLFGSEGELVLLRITVEPRLLEDLLDALAQLDFPVNPELCHRSAQVVVEFPAYEGKINQVRGILTAYRFEPDALEKTRILSLAAQV